MTKHKIIIYGTETCPWCHRVQDYFHEKGIEFQYKDVGSDEKARDEMLEKSQQMGVPVIDINDNIIVGFDEEAIKRLIK